MTAYRCHVEDCLLSVNGRHWVDDLFGLGIIVAVQNYGTYRTEFIKKGGGDERGEVERIGFVSFSQYAEGQPEKKEEGAKREGEGEGDVCVL